MTRVVRGVLLGVLVAVLVPGVAAGAPRTTATVSTGGGPLNLRDGPSTTNAVTGQVPHGGRLSVSCQVYGQGITNGRRVSGYWNRLTNGSYVSDAYVLWRPVRPPALRWCGSRGEPVASVVDTGGGPLNVRRGPGTSYPVTGRYAPGAVPHVWCQFWGERISGPGGTTNAWNYLGNGRYVSDAMISWRPSRPSLMWCNQAAATVPPATAQEFINRVAGPARLGMKQFRVPASVTIAQAIMESGWGGSWLTRRDHNYFGIKCFGSPGRYAVGCRAYATSECGGGKCWRTTADFRAYRNASGSMVDHGYFLVSNPRYRNAFRYSNNPNQFAVEIHKAGYATSPTYATNVISVMKRYNLYRYDR